MGVKYTQVRQLLYGSVIGYLLWFVLLIGAENSVPFFEDIDGLYLFILLLIVSMLFAITLLAIEQLDTGQAQDVH